MKWLKSQSQASIYLHSRMTNKLGIYMLHEFRSLTCACWNFLMLSRAFVYLVEAKISSNLFFRALPSLRGLRGGEGNVSWEDFH